MAVKDSCRQALEELDRYLDGECPVELETAIARHLADCEPCLSRSDFEIALRAVIARHCRQAAPAGLLDRVLQRLR
jgi:anti-sigma factor (TIGR02949 family)